jgi:ubiquinone biosynthesis protein
VADLPRDLRHLLRDVRRGRVKIDLDLKRLEQFGHQLDSASNRLTMGILTASLVVGSSIIMTVEGGPQLFGLPLFGLLGFLIAFFNSLWILFAIWRSASTEPANAAWPALLAARPATTCASEQGRPTNSPARGARF